MLKLDIANRKIWRIERENETLKQQNAALNKSVAHWIRQALRPKTEPGAGEPDNRPAA